MQGEAGCTLPTPPWLHPHHPTIWLPTFTRIGRRGLVVFVGTFAILFNELIPWVVGSRPTLCAYMKFFWICFTTNLMQYWNNIGITADLNIFFINDEDMFTWWATNRLWLMQSAQCFHDTHFIMSTIFDKQWQSYSLERKLQVLYSDQPMSNMGTEQFVHHSCPFRKLLVHRMC